tara:strand:- start:344 stop:2071 length:1728 start_codon:yes stop_codon:yes gene_type:complete
MSKLFKDALDDAQKLREIAEQNATNKIIEAVAPRIKMLIEQELADDDADGETTDEEAIEFFDEEGDEMPVEAAADDLVSPEAAALPSEVPPIDMAPPVEPVAIPAAPTEFSFEKDGKQVKVSVTVESKDSKVTNIKKMSVSQLLRALNETKSRNVQKAILKELRTIRRKLIIMSEAGDKNSQTKLNALNLLLKENTVMRRRNAGRRLNENAWWLLKEEDEEGGEELDLDMGGDEEAGDEGGDEGGDVDVDAASSALEDLGAALGLDIEVEEEDEEGGDEEGGDEDLDLDLEEADHDEKDHDEMYEMDDMDEADHDDMDEEDEMDEMMEISESMLRREIARLSGKRAPQNRRARRASARLAESRRRRMARRRRLAEMGDPVAAMHGGAEEVIEVTEEDLINALAEELGDSAGAELNIDGSGSAEAVAGHYGGGAVEGAALSERRRARRAQRQLAEARKEAKLLRRQAAAAKKELKESNLFNAKLLYVNKLMQSYDLNVKQQRAIVEALDNAQTLREAKLLYTSLTESLKKGRSTKGGTMNESVSRTGSASKSVRSSAPAKNGSELGRWAVLAGLNK